MVLPSSRRTVLAGAAAALATGWPGRSPLRAAAPAELPLIPFPTSLSYYEHGWIQWLPDHPEFEAIEMQIAGRGPGQSPLARVFMSRRGEGKTQIFYFDDRAMVAGWRVGQAYYSSIRYELSGEAGGPRGFSVRFTDRDGRPASWRMGFEGAQLTPYGGGLRASVGHSHDLIFSLPVRGPTATATSGELDLGGARYVVEPNQPYRPGRGGGYSAGEHTSLILLNPVEVAPTRNGFAMLGHDFAFTGESGRGTWRWAGDSGGGRGAAIELDTMDGALTRYRHFAGPHVWAFEFADPLPPTARIRGGESFRMAMAWDGARLVEAMLRAERSGDEVLLHWRASAPGWLSERPLEARIGPRAGGGYRLRVARSASPGGGSG